MTDTSQQYCTFYVDGVHFGIEVLEVQEVLRYQAMTHVPLSPSEIRGLINLRGQIVTAFDLRTRLQMPVREDGRRPMNVVVRAEDGAVSLLVDEIGDVIETREDDFEPPPATLDEATRSLLRGVYKMDGRLLLILDCNKTLAIVEDGAAVS